MSGFGWSTRLDFAPDELKNENPKNASNAVIRFFT